MKKTKYFKEPQVSFARQDKRDETKNTDAEKIKRLSNTQYLLHIIQ